MSKQVLESFYNAFADGDAAKMGSYYHENAVFNDPAFKNLNAGEVRAMWEMLIERSNGKLDIEHHSIIADDQIGQCTWEAKYLFSKTGNQVHNIIHSTMEFEDGLIKLHNDHFNFWRWSSMALGMPGKLLGWTPYLKGKVSSMAMKSLRDYISRSA
ncbi:MAG: nuclear transport factor 2 family protein [Cyclobacteriaceae bacterium]